MELHLYIHMMRVGLTKSEIYLSFTYRNKHFKQITLIFYFLVGKKKKILFLNRNNQHICLIPVKLDGIHESLRHSIHYFLVYEKDNTNTSLTTKFKLT